MQRKPEHSQSRIEQVNPNISAFDYSWGPSIAPKIPAPSNFPRVLQLGANVVSVLNEYRTHALWILDGPYLGQRGGGLWKPNQGNQCLRTSAQHFFRGLMVRVAVCDLPMIAFVLSQHTAYLCLGKVKRICVRVGGCLSSLSDTLSPPPQTQKGSLP